MKLPKIRKLPSGKYFCQLRLDGRSISITDATPQLVSAKAMAYKTGLMKAKEKPAELTLDQAIDFYIDARSNMLSPSTVRGYKGIKKNRFQSVMQRPIGSIRNWQNVLNEEAKLCSPKTLQNSWGFVAAVMEDLGVRRPKVSLPQVQSSNRPWLDNNQILRFVEAVKGEECEIPALLALQSLRRSEILGLTWDHVDLKKKRLTVQGAIVFNADQKLTAKTTNKNASSARTIPIFIPSLYDALMAVPDKTGYVVTTHPNTLYSQINRVCEKAGLPKVGFHGLRHSFASLAYHLGIPERNCMLIGGWSDTRTMHNIYTHLYANDVAQSEQQMAGFFLPNH